MTLQNRRITNLLRAFQVLFYAAFVILWFKGNYPPLKKIPVPAAVPLAGLAVATILRAVARLKRKPPRLRLKITRDAEIIGLIVLLVAVVHIPFLLYNFGLMDSDEAIPVLQGKHIAEGKLPAAFYYGALFQGSLPQHYYALLFRVFGYSIFMAKLAALVAFCAFVAVQFILLLRLYSREFAVLASLFYLLPFRHLARASFDIGSGFPVVFLLGAVIFTLTEKICKEKNDRLLPALGFVMGLAFWTHQIAIVFLLTSGIFLVLGFRFHIKPYLTVAFYFLLGVLPLVVSEIYWKFPVYRTFFKSGSAWTLGSGKFANGAKLALELVSRGPAWANALFFAAVATGLAVLAARVGRGKKNSMANLYLVYVLVYALVYFLSGSSSQSIVRYLYILYIGLPVLLVSALFWIRPKFLRRGAIAVLFLGLFLVNGREDAAARFRYVRNLHADLKKVVAVMSAIGNKYWACDYWTSYLLTAVSGEKFIIASTSIERYPAYRLVYDTEATQINRIFWDGYGEAVSNQKNEGRDFIALLEQTGKKFKTVSMGTWLFVYGAEGYVYEQNRLYPPSEIPEVTFVGAAPAASDIVLRFTAKSPLSAGDFQLYAEVPGFCSRFAPIGPGSDFIVRIPYPPQRSVRLRYYLRHLGLLLDPTVRETGVVLPAPPPPSALDPVDLLSGVGPRESATGYNWPVLERVVTVRINRPLSSSNKISIGLYSPFYFNDPWWYGDFAQTVDIQVNGAPARSVRLADGRNTVRLTIQVPPFTDGVNVLTLKFAYAFVLSVRNYWKTAAFLQDLSIE
jgi:hypothetical protein